MNILITKTPMSDIKLPSIDKFYSGLTRENNSKEEYIRNLLEIKSEKYLKK